MSLSTTVLHDGNFCNENLHGFLVDANSPYSVEIESSVYEALIRRASVISGTPIDNANDAISIVLEFWEERSGKTLSNEERSTIYHTDGGVYQVEEAMG
jgi:hypothetical protein